MTEMNKDYIRYDLLAQEALRGVVRQVLASAAQQGLPGDHHFYISIDTTAPGVILSEKLRGDYPQEMTVILQHQFWDLEVDDTGFSVTLSFGGNPERLVIPYSSIKGFFDPSVQFGLEFVNEDPDAAVDPAAEDMPATAALAIDDLAGDSAEPRDPDAETSDEEGATVVSLDAFRKKG
ncbi:SspB family protein [Tepidamorphus sp. 3E244]|uniref:SspB family protein n=1 Tax=Tepidamorphus sp. 3E244 TaxID=3385498 RepID=UPI0038FD2597